MWDLFDDTICKTCPENAHTSAMNTYRLWMYKHTIMASRLALRFPEALMVWPEDNLSNLSERYTHLGSKGLKERSGLEDAVRAVDVKACQLQG